MNENLSKSVILNVQNLYSANAHASQFFDALASRQKDASATSIESIMRSLNISRKDALELARAVDRTGAAELYLGRRGAKTRLEWKYSCISVGRAASGEASDLEQLENPISDDEDQVNSTHSEEESSRSSLTIPEAKRLLAQSLGVSETNIEITVRA